MKSLANYISERLEGRKFCIVYGNEISRIWPPDSERIRKRDAAIQAFARSRGWTATIWDPGVRVTFRKAASGPAKIKRKTVEG
jgi:hypothetical protein